jgi:CRISPR system Cascade subunit CasA
MFNDKRYTFFRLPNNACNNINTIELKAKENMPIENFNLVNDAWLPVTTQEGNSKTVGLKEIFSTAHAIKGLNLEFGIQEPAILRMLIACAYRILGGPNKDEEWKAIWRRKFLPEDKINEYFERWSCKFELFSEKAPFFQLANLEPENENLWKPATELVLHAPAGNNIPLFMPVSKDGTLLPAEAALWLIVRHAWGTTADKSGAKSDPKVKKGKASPSTGILGRIGFVAPIGKNFFETLLLNLIPLNENEQYIANSTTEGDCPVWEAESQNERKNQKPNGICELLTWQGRRIRLVAGEKNGETIVAKVFISAGDDIPKLNDIKSIEPHTSWRRNKNNNLEFHPFRPVTGQQIWRGLSAILALGDTKQRASCLSFVSKLKDEDEKDEIKLESLLVSSAQYGSMNSVMEDILIERLDVPIAVLRTSDLEAAQVAESAVKLVDDVAKAIGDVAELLVYSNKNSVSKVPNSFKKDAKRARSVLEEEVFAIFDQPFRALLRGLSEVFDLMSLKRSWRDKVETELRSIVEREMSRLLPNQMPVGVYAENMFYKKLSEALNHFYQE